MPWYTEWRVRRGVISGTQSRVACVVVTLFDSAPLVWAEVIPHFIRGGNKLVTFSSRLNQKLRDFSVVHLAPSCFHNHLDLPYLPGLLLRMFCIIWFDNVMLKQSVILSIVSLLINESLFKLFNARLQNHHSIRLRITLIGCCLDLKILVVAGTLSAKKLWHSGGVHKLPNRNKQLQKADQNKKAR